MTTPKKNTKTNNSDKPIETKAEKFIRIATSRTNKILKYLDLLGNCSSNNYQYTEKQVKQMFESIYDKLSNTNNKFINTQESKESFKFQEN